MGEINQELAQKFYYQMFLIREVENAFLELFTQGLLRGTIHTSIGQEACAVGVVNALDLDKDIIFSNHRAHGHFIAYSDDITGIIAEVMGKQTGVCGGIGGSQHLHKANLYTNGIQGGIVPNAVGAALAEKLNQSNAICVVFLGDGTMGQGVVYESMNVASLWKLPVLFVLEENKYAQSTPKHLAHAGDITTRSESFNIPRYVLDANDVFRVFQAAKVACNRVRSESLPFFLILDTYRLGPHSKGDDTRSAEEINAFRSHDPITLLAQHLELDDRNKLEKSVKKRVQDAITKCLDEHAPSVMDFREKLNV